MRQAAEEVFLEQRRWELHVAVVGHFSALVLLLLEPLVSAAVPPTDLSTRVGLGVVQLELVAGFGPQLFHVPSRVPRLVLYPFLG